MPGAPSSFLFHNNGALEKSNQDSLPATGSQFFTTSDTSIQATPQSMLHMGHFPTQVHQPEKHQGGGLAIDWHLRAIAGLSPRSFPRSSPETSTSSLVPRAPRLVWGSGSSSPRSWRPPRSGQRGQRADMSRLSRKGEGDFRFERCLEPV